MRIFAELKIEAGETFLYLNVADTGAGFDEKKMSPDGIGLENIRQRLRAHYGKQAHLMIESNLRKGTRAEIKLPVKAQIV